jgi:1,4-dihydroxy-2-naphthoyl-CoA synthase
MAPEVSAILGCDAEIAAWCREILARSPTAIAIAKHSFNADSDNIRGIGALGFEAGALLRHRGGEGGDDRLSRKAPCEFPCQAPQMSRARPAMGMPRVIML